MSYKRFIAPIASAILTLSVVFAIPVKAQSITLNTLEIKNIPQQGNSIVVELNWTTNTPVYSTIYYGTDSKKIDQKVIISGAPQTSFTSRLSGLKGDTNYYFQIEIARGLEKERSFIRTFKTPKSINTILPEITKAEVSEYTGKTAVIRWHTDNIDSRGTVKYGLTPEKLNSRVSTNKGKLHEAVLKGLKPGTRYYYQIVAEAADKQIQNYIVDSFRTVDTDLPDRENLNINQIRPLTVDEALVGSTDLTVRVQTNRSSAVTVTLTPTTKGGKSQTKKTVGFRETTNSIYFDKLQPNTTYKATISVKDVVGRQIKMSNITFATRASNAPTTATPVGAGKNIQYSKNRIVKTDGNPTVYILIKDAKYQTVRRLAIMNEEAFYSYGLRWNQVETVSRAELQSYPLVRLIRTENNPAVYMIDPERRLKLVIPNETVFSAYGFDWSQVVRVNDQDVRSYYQTVLVKEPNTSTIYLIDGQTKKAFNNETSFARSGFSFEQVFTISPKHLQWFSESAQVI